MAKEEKNKNLSFEASMKELEVIVRQLEQGELPLEESLKKFKRGVELSDFARKELQEAEKTFTKIVQADGSEAAFENNNEEKGASS